MASGGGPPQAKRLKKTLTATIPAAATKTAVRKFPASIVIWNCNGLIKRAENHGHLLEKLLKETNSPDLICLQEARVKAASPNNRGLPVMEEPLRKVLKTTFSEYKPYWSLADTKHAGTCTLIHKRLLLDTTTNATTTTTAAASIVTDPKMAYTTSTAINLLLEERNLTREQVGLKMEPQEVASKKKKKQSSILSHFAPKTTASSSSTAAANSKKSFSNQQQRHHPEGRFQFISFPDLDVLQTYVPNNGMKPESWKRRDEWDAELKQFLLDRNKIMSSTRTATTTTVSKPLLWCGDFNCAFQPQDGTHWQVVRNNKSDDDDSFIYEWWTDERKCIIGNNKNSNKPTDRIGMPSFTPAERRRFGEFLKIGNLVDVWRELHSSPGGAKAKVVVPQEGKNWNEAHWTWRGAGRVYGGKGQRLDYFLVSQSIMEMVERCEILGYGEQKEGLFCGSDHCACILKFKGSVVSVGPQIEYDNNKGQEPLQETTAF